MATISRFKGFMLDLDGTVYRGERLIPGAAESIARLRAEGRKLLFVTNNATQSRDTVARRLERHGIPCAPSDVITGTYLVARHLKETRQAAKVFVAGERGLCEELEQADLTFTTDPAAWPGSSAVVVAADRRFHYDKLNAAVQAVLHGAYLVAPDRDATYPVDGGGIMPGTGALLAAVETAVGRSADLVAGKPSHWAAQVACELLGLAPSDCVMIGDRLDSDIAFGRLLGGRCLVLSGVTAPHQVPDDDALVVLETLAQLNRSSPSLSQRE